MSRLTIQQLFDLSGKTAIVTGAAQGIGRAVAIRLAEAGAHVVVAGHNEAGLEATARMITENGGRALGIGADMLDLDSLDRTVDFAIAQFGGIDILVNCAGGAHPFTPALDLTEELWDKTLDRNLKGSFFLAQKAARWMVDAKAEGAIINIASIAGLRPDPQLVDYSASKAALISMTRSLAQEFGVHRIRVNAIAPGAVLTPNTAHFYQIPAIQELIAQRTPLGHPAQPEDIDAAVLFLASQASRHITGAVVVIDGGMTVT